MVFPDPAIPTVMMHVGRFGAGTAAGGAREGGEAEEGETVRVDGDGIRSVSKKFIC